MPKWSVKKPFTVLVAVLAIIILGIVSTVKMQLDLLPEISLPYLLVITTYPGASSEKVEADVCEPMENSLGVITGVENIYSICSENYGIVELEFRDGTDLDSAMVKVSSALNTLQSSLPEECGTPSIMEIGTDMLATSYLALSREGMSIEELSQFANDKIIPEFERGDGVASVSGLGLIQKTIQIELNESKVDELNDKILAKADDAFADALTQLDKAKKQLEDSEDKLNDSKKSLVDGKKDLEDGKQELIDGAEEIKKGRKELDDKTAEIESNKQKLEDGKKELDKQEKETYDGLAKASNILDQLNAYKTQLTKQQAEKTAVEKMIEAAESYNALVASRSALEGLRDMLALFPDDSAVITDATIIGTLSQITGNDVTGITVGEAKTIVQTTLDGINAGIAQIEGAGVDPAKLDEYKNRLDELTLSISVTQAIIDGYEKELKALGYTYEDIEKAKLQAAEGFGVARSQLASSELALDSAGLQLDSARTSLDDAEKQINSGWDSLKDGEKQLSDGWKQVKEGEDQISDGWEDYNDAVKQYEKQKKEALRKANADDLVSLSTLAGLVYAQNFAMPSGYVDDSLDNSWLVEIGKNFKDVHELEDSVLCHIDDIGDVKLTDVADITIIDNSLDNYVRLNGEQAVILSVYKSSTAGTNDVSKVLRSTIKDLEAEYPGLSIKSLMDQGDYISLIIGSVLQSMLIGAVLAIFILAVFLKNFKPTFVVALSIPLSVMLALILMYFSKISLNMLSLSGLALGIGMLVDNSVVVIENIYRLRSKGIEAPRAAVQGTRQVAGAIISSTLTTVCVFLPMIYTTGLVNELMTPMCLTIIYCLIASLIIAMSVVPAAGSTILRNTKNKPHPVFDKMMDVYEKALSFCLRFKVVPIGVAVALLIISAILVIRMGIVMIPEMTANQIQATLTVSEDLNKTECYELADKAIEEIVSVEGIGTVGVIGGDDSQLFTGNLSGVESDFRTYSLMILTEDEKAGEDEIRTMISEMENRIEVIDDVELEVSTAMSEMGQVFGSGLSIRIYGSDVNELLDISRDVMDIVGEVEGFTNISNGEEDAPQVIHLNIDKNKAMGLGLTVAEIYQDITMKLTHSVDSVKLNIDGIDMQVKIVNHMDPLTKENLMDHTFAVSKTDEDGDTVTEDVKLSDIATVEIRDGVSTINRENQGRFMTVTADVEEGYNTTLLTRKLKPLLDAYKAPNGYSVELSGEYDTVVQMLKQMGLVILLGMAFIYFVMVAQFQSLLSPFIVMFTIPLAFTGGLASLWLTGENLSVLAIMGFVVLMGTVVNNGIVFVDYVNQLRKGGLDRHTALIATGKTRMRPILMTALTTILAESYLIFGDDMGSQMGRGMALVIAGGLAYATLMTLFIIPVMYDIMFKKAPLDVDTGREDLDDVPDDAAEYLMGNNTITSDDQ